MSLDRYLRKLGVRISRFSYCCLLAILSGCSAMAPSNADYYDRSDVIRYLEQVKASLRQERTVEYCQIDEYSDRSKDTVDAVLQLSGHDLLEWRKATAKIEGIDVELIAGLGSKRLSIGVELRRNRCHRFEIAWIVP